MAHIKTSKGFLEYESHFLYFGDRIIDKEVMLENIKILSVYLDKIDINWGPAFGTLIGIIRNDDFQPWKPVFDIYILKEDEERFKDILWLLKEVGFEVVRYEQYIKVFVLHKISSDVRHTGGSDFIHEKYLQNTVKWDFKGIELNVPADVDEYLTFQYGEDWVIPKQTVFYSTNPVKKWYHWLRLGFKIICLMISTILGCSNVGRRILSSLRRVVREKVFPFLKILSLQA